jgi:hypothetical protein
VGKAEKLRSGVGGALGEAGELGEQAAGFAVAVEDAVEVLERDAQLAGRSAVGPALGFEPVLGGFLSLTSHHGEDFTEYR